MITYQDLKGAVTAKVRASVIRSLYEYVSDRDSHLWARLKPRDFLKKTLLISLYKFITNVGFPKLFLEISSWYRVGSRTLRHNVKTMRKLLGKWGSSQISLGDSGEWNRSSKKVKKGAKFEKINLWIDSTDFQLARRGDKEEQKKIWSYKMKSPGRRYTMLQDAAGRIRMLWGGYNPKIYDGDFLCIATPWMNQNLLGATIVGDQHYQKSPKDLKIPIITPTKLPKKTKSSKLKDWEKITAKQRSRNLKIRKIRARVELPFAYIDQHFKSLSAP